MWVGMRPVPVAPAGTKRDVASLLLGDWPDASLFWCCWPGPTVRVVPVRGARRVLSGRTVIRSARRSSVALVLTWGLEATLPPIPSASGDLSAACVTMPGWKPGRVSVTES